MTDSDVRVCHECGYENRAQMLICTACGTLLVPTNKTRIQSRPLVLDEIEHEPRWGTAQFKAGMQLVVTLHETDAAFAFDYEETDEIMIGRHDTDTGVIPHIDLQPHGGAEAGISRQHASIARDGTQLSLKDRASANGTFLNAQRLVPGRQRILRDGDDVRVGDLLLRIQFRRASSASSKPD